MAEMTNDEIGDEAVRIANEIQIVLAGRSTAAAYLAIGMVLGHSASVAARPNLVGLMRNIHAIAAEELQRTLSNG